MRKFRILMKFYRQKKKLGNHGLKNMKKNKGNIQQQMLSCYKQEVN